ncbi:MAG: NADH-quinone oxidoreductase subunit H [Bdellovibrionales bacterium]
MGQDVFEISVNAVKLLLIFLMMVQMVPLLVWVERRGSAFIQHRFGPNRVGPLGLTQLLADAVKFICKEEFVPAKANALLYYGAPVAALIPAALALASIPLSTPIEVQPFEMAGKMWGPYIFNMQGVYMHVGIIYILGVSSLGAYSLLMAGWGSANKYSLMGALRASAQMISYELAMGIAIVATVLLYGTFDLTEMIHAQAGPLRFGFLGQSYQLDFLPNWGIFFQPVGFVLFFTAVFAESNRLPFDLPESEGELVAGFHTEYGGFKMLLFFMGEYGHMMVASCLLSIFYFGGYGIPFVNEMEMRQFISGFVSGSTQISIGVSVAYLLSFVLKVAFFLWFFIWIRWTLPRFRYDHLMDLGWKTMLPWAIGNIVVTAFAMLLARGF